MKKLLILLALVAALSLTMTACGGSDAPETEEEPPLSVQEEEPAANETEDPAEESEEPEEEAEPEDEQKPAESKPEANTPAAKPSQTPEQQPSTQPEQAPAPAATVGQTLKGVFTANPSGSAQQVADRILAHDSIPFSSATMAVEPGLLMGFGNTEITGFSEGVMFGPAMGTIPFLGYIFILDGSVDASTFMQTLQGAADPRWNICTEADQTVIASSGNTIFFLMCPNSLEG